jgi:hypothetical protein
VGASVIVWSAGQRSTSRHSSWIPRTRPVYPDSTGCFAFSQPAIPSGITYTFV